MKAIVSGRAGIAFLFQGDEALYIRYPGATAIPCHMEVFPFLFGDARDLQFLEEAEVSDAEALLRSEVAKEQALQMALILLDGTDGGYPPPIRSSAARELEEFLADPDLEEYLSRVLFAHPLSRGGDLGGAFACLPADSHLLRDLLEELRFHQTHIAAICLAWGAIPMRAFGGLRERASAKALIVRSGGFRDLSRARARGSAIDPSIADCWPSDLRRLVEEWISAMRRDLQGPWPAILDDGAELGMEEIGTSLVAENGLDDPDRD